MPIITARLRAKVAAEGLLRNSFCFSAISLRETLQY